MGRMFFRILVVMMNDSPRNLHEDAAYLYIAALRSWKWLNSEDGCCDTGYTARVKIDTMKFLKRVGEEGNECLKHTIFGALYAAGFMEEK